MLKYVALLKVEPQKQMSSSWHSCSSAQYFKSPIETEKEKAEKWLEVQEKKYLHNSEGNNSVEEQKYVISKSILAFDEQESYNFENFLNKLIPFNQFKL